MVQPAGGISGAPCVRGFTLIEMLVVLGIAMAMMGLGVAAFISRPQTDALLGAEHLFADLVRQARHTARTSGAPVVLNVKQKERVITGVTSVPVWNDGFERCADPGRTGKGLHTGLDYPRSGGVDPVQQAADIATVKANRDRDENLLTGASRLLRAGTSPGIHLSCMVRPPDASGHVGAILPLVMLADGAVLATDPEDYTANAPPSASDFATITKSGICGLVLQGQKQDETAGRSDNAARPYWEVVGWVRDSTGFHEVSSTADPPPGITRDATDPAGPITGGAWIEVSLLIEPKQQTTLLVDGRVVAVSTVGVDPVTLGCTSERVIVGCARLNPTDISGGPARLTYADNAVIDEVMLRRLGTGTAGNLPTGIAPTDDAWITCLPDGRVWVRVGTAGTRTDGGEISVKHGFDGDSATITIGASGSVISEVKRQ